ncbi:MAG: YhgE/Pip family protein [Microthrixaceae bacterium]|nr:YhgE/Pip family protein [Microthrixaceae bacterium]
MTLPIERARTRRPITWLTVLGVILLPVLIGGVLVAALYNPTERLENITAAIVNNDEPVTIDGQYVPLGRQLTAGLVDGGDADSNLSWIISNTEDAASGLADGTFSAVVTIPENFSSAATSTANPDTATQAVIEVQTPKNSLIVDDAITAQVTQTAADVMGTQLSQIYLENVFLGFTTLGDQLGEAATGAGKLGTGAYEARTGALALGDGAHGIAGGAGGIADGANALGGGLDQLAGGTRDAAGGAKQLGGALHGTADQVSQTPTLPQPLIDLAMAAWNEVQNAAGELGGLNSTLSSLSADCMAETGGAQAYCDRVAAAAGQSAAISGSLETAKGMADQLAAGLKQLAESAAPATAQLVAGLRTIANETQGLGAGLDTIAGGIGASASGARELAGGATQLQSGATQLGNGATALADGISAIGDGANELASGLDQAVAALPAYDEQQRASLAEVVSNPVGTNAAGSSLFGASAIPLLSVLALWIGAIGTYIVLQASSRRALTSRSSSLALAARGFVPGAVIGAVQGILVAGVVQIAGSYAWGEWFGFAALCVLAGVAFAAVNQALVAAFGGIGRWIAAAVAVLVVATGVVSTVPGMLTAIAGVMPTAAAYQAMLGALSGAAGIGAGVAGLIVFAVLAFAVSVFAVSRRRTASAARLVAAAA